jgi:hypothetical protein
MTTRQPHPRSRLRIEIDDHGSFVSFTPLDKRARTWVEEHVWYEPWQWLGGSLNVDHRYAGDIVAGIQKIWRFGFG